MPDFLLRLRPMSEAADPTGTRRLRALLKAALRSFGLKCVEIRPVEMPLQNAAPAAPSGKND